MKQKATSNQMVIAQKLAKMASDEQIQYTPTGNIDKVGHFVWYEMSATKGSQSFKYWLRREYGSYAGGF